MPLTTDSRPSMTQPISPDTEAASSLPETWSPTAFEAPDFYDLDALLSEEATAARDEVRAFVTEEVAPVIEKYAQRAEFPQHLIPAFAEHGLLGPTLPPEHGGGGQSNLVYGLMMQELERGDSGLRSFCSVTGSLVMYPIWRYGSEAQKERWLPALAHGEAVGCFGLTEPEVGSNPSALQTHARRGGDAWILNGHKRWATNATIADVAVIWAKDEDDVIRGFLVETDRDGVATPPIDDTWSLRTAVTSEVVLDDVRVPEAHRLPAAEGIKAPLSCLTQARYGICWGAVGAARDCFEVAREYAIEREQFDGPVARFQLQQENLAEMATGITTAHLLADRLADLKERGDLRPQQVSMAKRNNVRMAREVARTAREMLGGNGITTDYSPMRHLANIETVYTYEGTHDIHTLVLGEDLTGIPAFE